MPRSRPARTPAPLFAALGDDTRLKVISRLSHEGPLPIVRLTEGTTLSRQAITKHLRVLEDAGIVESTRNGRESMWQLRPKRLSDARRFIEAISNEWEARIERLRAFVE